MVLLHLLQQVQKQVGFELAVAHVNHQLREASDEEEAFLRDYCRKHQLPLYVKRWETLPVTGMEQAARAFRYAFFQKVMQDHYFDTLMTAHHSDDQLETMLMKMMRDGQLQNAGGMRERRAFAGGRLVRPLLHFSKEEITAYAYQQGIIFYEDETNQLLEVQRNRLRHEVVPLLKRENPQLLGHFQQLSEQLFAAEELVKVFQKEWYPTAVTVGEGTWQLSVAALLHLADSQQYFAVKYLLQRFREERQITVSEEQLQALLALLRQERPQWRYDLGGGWQAVRAYDAFKLQQDDTPAGLEEHRLEKGQGLFLSPNEWVGLLPSDQEDNLPEKVNNWSEIRQVLPLDFPDVVTLRKRKPGDRIQLTAALRKKVSRVFIDKKVPNEKRTRSWLMEDDHENVLAVLPIAFSYLSIGSETDKIHYILVYKYRE